MATLAHYFDRWNTRTSGTARAAAPDASEAFRLRMFPNEDVYFFVKRIDNSRVVRQVDPKTRRTCWRMIGTTCAVAVFLTGTLLPGVYHLMAGYKLETLRQQRQHLETERADLEFQETSLLTNENLQKMADQHKFLDASLPQKSFYLEGKPDSAVAKMVPAAVESKP